MDLFAVLPRQRAVIDAEGDGDGGRIDGLRRDRVSDGEVADRVGHRGFRHARKADDIARFGEVDRLLRQAPERENLGDAELLDLLAIAAERFDGFAGFQRAAFNATGEDTPDERVGAERGGQHPEGFFGLIDLFRGGDMIHHQIEERGEVLARAFEAVIGPTGAA